MRFKYTEERFFLARVSAQGQIVHKAVKIIG